MILRRLPLAVALAAAVAGQAHAALDAPLAELMGGFATKASPEQVKQVADAITASPALQGRLEKLAAAGKLKSIDLVAQEDERLDDNKGAEAVAGRILMTGKFLLGQPPKRRVEAKPGDLDPPDNLIFTLAHIAYHLENPIDRGNLPQSQDARVNLIVRDEAKAHIQAWNDLVDAEAKLKGRPITVAEAQSLIPNLKYREYVIKAQGKLAVLAADGRLPDDGRTLNAMTSALFESNVPDFQ